LKDNRIQGGIPIDNQLILEKCMIEVHADVSIFFEDRKILHQGNSRIPRYFWFDFRRSNPRFEFANKEILSIM
jgi:hypothetical protein